MADLKKANSYAYVLSQNYDLLIKINSMKEALRKKESENVHIELNLLKDLTGEKDFGINTVISKALLNSFLKMWEERITEENRYIVIKLQKES